MDMIEKVARAICRDFHKGKLSGGDLDNEVHNAWDLWTGEAAAAIKAMMEPDMTMLNAAVDATGAGSDMSWANRSPQSLFETGYRAMIAAIGREVGDGRTT